MMLKLMSLLVIVFWLLSYDYGYSEMSCPHLFSLQELYQITVGKTTYNEIRQIDPDFSAIILSRNGHRISAHQLIEGGEFSLEFKPTSENTYVVIRIEPGLNFDNESDRHQFPATKYSISSIEELKRRIDTEQVTYWDFCEKFSTDCIRRIKTGYYVKLFGEDGSMVFVYIKPVVSTLEDRKKPTMLVESIKIYKEFMSAQEFCENIHVGDTRAKVVSYDNNGFINEHQKDVEIFVVKEGIILISYENEAYTGEKLVESVKFVSDSTLKEDFSSNMNLLPELLYVLEIDKRCK